MTWRLNVRSGVLLVAAALLARLAVLWILPETSYSSDLRYWAEIAGWLREGENPYRHKAYLNYPPLWMQILYVIDRVSRSTHIPFVVALRLFLILTDTASILVAAAIASRFVESSRNVLLWGLSLNPILILLVCQHANFDALVVLILLCFLWALLRFQELSEVTDWLFASLALGVGILAKTFPLVLAPLLAYRGSRIPTRARILGGILVVAPAALGLSVIYVLAPWHVMNNVIRYRGVEGYFGISGILEMLGLDTLSSSYARLFPIFLLASLVWLGFTLVRARELRPAELILIAATIFLMVIGLGPGYGPQYAAWHLPLLVLTFHSFDQRWKHILTGAWVVALITYLIEYALFPSHGAFLSFAGIGERMSSKSAQTLLRLPLFITYLLVIVAALRRLVGPKGVAFPSVSSRA